MKWLVNLKRKFYNSKKIRQQIFFYCQDLIVKNDITKLEVCDKMFGNYILNSNDFTEKFFRFIENLSIEEKKLLLSNMIRTAILYKSTGEIKTDTLWNEEERNEFYKSADYILNVTQHKDYFELDGYKLPINLFLKEVFYQRLSLDKVNKEYFKDKDIIDAGACIGDSALILSEYTIKNVHAFEPASKNYDLLQKTINLNNKTNIIPVKYALGDEEIKSKLNLYIDNLGSTTIIEEKDSQSLHTEEIKVIKLDDYVSKNNLDVGLIKADVEGFEQNLLNGAKKTIEKFKPTLLICTYHRPEDFFGIKFLIESWNLGYSFKYAPAVSTGNFTAETMLIAEPIDVDKIV